MFTANNGSHLRKFENHVVLTSLELNLEELQEALRRLSRVPEYEFRVEGVFSLFFPGRRSDIMTYSRMQQYFVLGPP